LSSIANCTRDEGYEAVNTSDLVEHLRTSVSRAGGIGVVGPHCKENNKSGTGLEVEKTKHRSKRPRPEMLLKSKLHGENMKRSGRKMWTAGASVGSNGRINVQTRPDNSARGSNAVV
jgi:hypothetical protein